MQPPQMALLPASDEALLEHAPASETLVTTNGVPRVVVISITVAALCAMATAALAVWKIMQSKRQLYQRVASSDHARSDAIEAGVPR